MWQRSPEGASIPPQVEPLHRHATADALQYARGICKAGAFNLAVSAVPPSPGAIPTGNLVSLWAWDAEIARWIFYTPLLEGVAPEGSVQCGDALRCHARSHGFHDFRGDSDYGYDSRNLRAGVGFWVNRP